jgi:hypothetical protein
MKRIDHSVSRLPVSISVQDTADGRQLRQSELPQGDERLAQLRPRSTSAGRSGSPDFSSVPRRPRTVRHSDPALRGNWTFAPLPQVPEATMSPEEAASWHRNRLEDDALIDHVLDDRLKVLGVSPNERILASRGLRKFAKALADADKSASLTAFLTRTGSSHGDDERDAGELVSAILLGRDDAKHTRAEARGLKLALKTLREVSGEELDARRAAAMESFPASHDPRKLRYALPPQELALIEKVKNIGSRQSLLVRFSSRLLLGGCGGLNGWLAMYRDGRQDLAHRVLVEKLGAPGQGELAAIDALQEAAGVEPGWRIRIPGTRSYTLSVGIESRPAAETAGVLHDSAIQRTMTRAEALQWFSNRMDDASLIDEAYVRRLGGDPQHGAKRLRRFMKTLLDRDPNATLREFLARLSRDASIEDIAHEIEFFSDNAWARRNVAESLNALKHEVVDPEVATDRPDILKKSGTRPRDLLPPDDKSLMHLLDDDRRRSTPAGKPVDLAHTSAATRFALALMEKGIGGLAEWMSMYCQDASLQDRAEAKSLLDTFVRNSPGTARKSIFAALRRLQELLGVDRSYTIIKRDMVGPEIGQSAALPRRRGEGTSANVTVQPRQSAVVEPETFPWGHDLPPVPRRRRTRREAVVELPQDESEAVQSMAVDEVGPLNRPVKQESSQPRLRATQVPVYVEGDMLDQARTAFYREFQLCDLSSDSAEWRLHLNRNDAVVVHHRPEPIADNDHKFPLRDPKDPLHRVLPRYAGPDGECDEKVRIRDIRVGDGVRTYLQALVETDHRQQRRQRLQIDSLNLESVIERLQQDARGELDRLIHHGRAAASAPARCNPRRLEKEDVLAHEQSLVGQYGLFVRRPAVDSERPTLSNGQILGFYMGALLNNDRDFAQTATDHPDYPIYAIDTVARRGPVTYSAKGAANSIAFANTALKAGTSKPAYDTDRINSIFIDFSVGLVENKGRPTRESLIALVALDNLFDGNQNEVQVLVDYGEPFLEHFIQESGSGERFSSPAVKTEPELESQQDLAAPVED